jgi:CHAD domain-containing protein
MPDPATRSELLKRRLDRLTRALPGLEAGDIHALHQARVASRRLRELVPVVQLDHGASKKLARRLRKLTARLGTVRELDVLMLGIDEMHGDVPAHSGALARIGVAVSKDRDRARGRLSKLVPADDVRRLTRKLDKCVADLKLLESSSSRSAARSWKWAIEARLERRAGDLAAAVHDAGAFYIPERLHRVRIALKKLRYALELSNDVSGVRGGADVRMLKKGQDVLGRMHDLQVLIDRVRQVQASLAPPNVAVWRDLDALIAALENECRRLHARYMRTRDGLVDLAARLGAQQHGTDGAAAQRTRRAG